MELSGNRAAIQRRFVSTYTPTRANKCVGMLTWLHTEQKRFTEDEQRSGLNEKYFLEATERFLKGIHFVVQKSKRNEKYFGAKRPDTVQSLEKLQ